MREKCRNLLICIIMLISMLAVLSGCQKHEHIYGEWVVTTSATCTAEGVETRTCECGEEETRPIQQAAHTYGSWTITKTATCTDSGAEERVCGCGAKETKTINATGHNYAAANCNTPRTCVTCNVTEGTAKGHTYSNATCSKPKTCSVCGATEGTAIAHNYSNGTCTMCGVEDPTTQQKQNAAAAYAFLIVGEDYCNLFSEMIYDAWYFAIYKADDYTSGAQAIEAYSRSVGIDAAVVTEAVDSYLNDIGYTVTDITRRAVLGTNSGALYVVEYAMTKNEGFSSAKEAINKAKEEIQNLDRAYSSVNAYSELSSYYSAVNAYYSFCVSPSGSFSQLSNTLSTFRNNCADSRNKCSLYF